jgi:predicted Zn finger-like uncharacterized protein
MIIKCSHCAGKMRVDESRIPKGQSFKIRCPHCKEIGVIQDQPAMDQTPAPKVPAAASSIREKDSPAPRTTGNGVSEHSLPSDAFHSFRFPSEREAPLVEPPPSRRGLGIIIWVLVSLGIVAIFALLVNIILSGPGR